MTSTSAPDTLAPRPLTETYLRQIAAIGCAAAIAGVLVGGVGGRLAMRLLAATNEEDSGGDYRRRIRGRRYHLRWDTRATRSIDPTRDGRCGRDRRDPA